MAQKAILYTPFLRITGTEVAKTHVGTKCVDISGLVAEAATTTPLNFLLAPFDCTVKYIDRAANSVFFESIEEVEIPNSSQPTKMSFRCAHMNNDEWNLLSMYVGRKFYQGEPCYFEGHRMEGVEDPSDCPKHIHIEFGTGELVIESGSLPWKTVSKTYNGVIQYNKTITTTGTPIGIYNACYLHNDVILQTNGNEADGYVFKYENGTTITPSQYVSMYNDQNGYPAITSSCKMNLTNGPFTLRKYPGGSIVASGYTAQTGDSVDVLGFQPIPHEDDGFYYYRAALKKNGITRVGYMQYDPLEAYPTGMADKLFLKTTRATFVRSSRHENNTGNVVNSLATGALEKPREFINCSAEDHEMGWVQLESGNYIQYNPNEMYLFGICNY